MTLEEIKKRIEESDLSISEMARRAGLSRQAIYNIKNGKRTNLPMSTVSALTKVLRKR